MSIKVFQTNKTGKIEFTRCELEKLLNETYNEGYRDGEDHAKSTYWTWTSPSLSTTISTTNYPTNYPINYSTDYSTTTYSNSTDPIDALIAGKTTINDVAATITPTDCSVNVNEAKRISGQVSSDDKVLKALKADITASVDSPEAKGIQRTCQVDGMTFNLNDLAKTVDAMLSGKVDLFSSSNAKTSKAAVDNPFSNLAKELTAL